MKPYSYLLLIAACSLFSCEETEAPSYPITFNRGDIVPTGHFRLFTVNGEVTTSYTLNKYIVRDTAYLNNVASNLTNPNRIDRITFKNKSEATVTLNYSTFRCTMDSHSTPLILKRNDTTTLGSYGKQVKKSYGYLLAGVKPEIFSEFLSSSTRGNYVFGYRTREFRMLNGNSSLYSMPIVIYAGDHRIAEYGGFIAEIGYINNTLQPDFYKQLSASDTVAAMEYMIWYPKE